MGVKELWTILNPSCEKKSLWELQGLTIAIDLSSWIVDSQNVGENVNMYLRNLFFRTSYLLLLGVKPIFVLEGRAPELKHGTIARRQQALKENQIPKNKSGNRGRLNCLQKKCEELLLSLGVSCYKSEGEAEALCSKLNELGVVDAVISQDSDCFLYGARTVLRNFTMSPQYTCDMYTMEHIEAKLGLGRQKLLALSLLCGCDYEAGVHGVGKQSALKFLALLPDNQVLDRFRSWPTKLPSDCRTTSSQMTQDEKLEHIIRKKALLDPSFPSEEVISEFMTSKAVNVASFVWNKPSLPKFVVIAQKKLAWEDDYACNKFMPLVTRWDLLNGGNDISLTLEAIIKKRCVRSIPSYELKWKHDGTGELTTVEPAHLVAEVYPLMHEAYVKSKEKPKKGGRGRKNTQENNDQDHVENLIEKLNISGEKSKRPSKKGSKQKEIKGLQTLDRFLLREPQIQSQNSVESKPISTEFTHSTPLRNVGLSKPNHYLSDGNELDSPIHKNKSSLYKSMSLENIRKENLESTHFEHSVNFKSFGDLSVNSAAFDLSDIVNSIVNRTSCNPALRIWENNLN